MSEERKYYFIISHLNGMVLDVDGGNMGPGASVITYPKHGKENQQWYDHHDTGTIRSKSNGFCLDIEGDRLVLHPFKKGKCDQQWDRKDTVIANRHDRKMVLDISGGNKQAKAKVIKYQAHGGPNQSWNFEEVPDD